MNSKEAILQQVARAELREAIDLWLSVLSDRSPIRDDVVGFSARLISLNADSARGLINFNEEMQARNQLMMGMLKTLNTWEPGGDSGPVENAIH
ncbi:MAG: hypothetical protein H6576_14665 [Lewinellaceae bacterium]|nr:hypothetical protein [Saprospiraceae bacterium]MCB9344940.1 hypothetical protein [Lewinellaceae bacterium]